MRALTGFEPAQVSFCGKSDIFDCSTFSTVDLSCFCCNIKMMITFTESDEEDNADDDLYEDRQGNERMDDDDDEEEEENERDITSGGIKGEGLDGTFKTDQV